MTNFAAVLRTLERPISNVRSQVRTSELSVPAVLGQTVVTSDPPAACGMRFILSLFAAEERTLVQACLGRP